MYLNQNLNIIIVSELFNCICTKNNKFVFVIIGFSWDFDDLKITVGN